MFGIFFLNRILLRHDVITIIVIIELSKTNLAQKRRKTRIEAVDLKLCSPNVRRDLHHAALRGFLMLVAVRVFQLSNRALASSKALDPENVFKACTLVLEITENLNFVPNMFDIILNQCHFL